jgi:hypothetical protein
MALSKIKHLLEDKIKILDSIDINSSISREYADTLGELLNLAIPITAKEVPELIEFLERYLKGGECNG